MHRFGYFTLCALCHLDHSYYVIMLAITYNESLHSTALSIVHADAHYVKTLQLGVHANSGGHSVDAKTSAPVNLANASAAPQVSLQTQSLQYARP